MQDGQTAREILRNSKGFYAKYYGTYKQLFGNSRLTADDPVWRKLRDYSQPHITGVNADEIVRVSQFQFSDAVRSLLSKSRDPQEPVDIFMDHAAAATLAQTILGFDLSELGKTAVDDIRVILNFASWANFPRPLGGGVDHAMLEIDAEEAKARLQQSTSSLLARLSHDPSDGLFATLAGLDDDEVDVFGEICTMLFAGFDTTASAITWAMHLLGQDQTLQQTLRESVKHLTLDKPLQAQDVIELEALNSFVLEVLRLFPPIPVLSRISQEDVTVQGLEIPKGRRILISMIGVQQTPEVFETPTAVQLDRHPKGMVEKSASMHFVPFGDGKRICPGARFANVEILTALVVILKSMAIQSPKGNKLELRWDASMRQLNGTRLALLPLT